MSALTAAVALGTLGPSATVAADPVLAVPATTASASSVAPEAARTNRISRDRERPTAAQGSAAAARREATLAKQDTAIDRAAAQAAARAKAAKAAKAAAERARYAKLGYKPGTTDPRDIARQMMKNRYGWGADQYGCFNNIIMRESMWQIDATNPSSGAYGIPQALPGTKMATAGADWRTNPATQIEWALGYLKDRYGTPCGGWAFKSSHGWY